MFKRTIIALSMLTVAASVSAVELTNNTKPTADHLWDGLVAVNAKFTGTGEMAGITYVFVSSKSTSRNNELICDVAVRAVIGDIAIFVVGNGGKVINCK